MKRTNNRKGFTLAEVLIVVGILVVLMAVGFVALTSHARNMHQLEMDGQAKEIFVAAQNHLTMAESQGYMGLANKTGSFGTPETVKEGEQDHGVCYFVVGKDGTSPNDTGFVLNQMLPFGSVDEAARTGGSYIIRYQKSPAVILDVFYVSTTGRYSHTFSKSEYNTVMALADGVSDDGTVVSKKSERRSANIGPDNGVVVGYYGGAAATAPPKGEWLEAPKIEIFNAERLQVKVTDFNSSTNDGKNALTLLITGVKSKAVMQCPLVGAGGTSISVDKRVAIDGNSYTVTLDSVTEKDLHFSQLAWLYEDSKIKFIPGEDLQIKAVSYNNSIATNVAESGTVTTNSLFAELKPSDSDSNRYDAQIANIRHLLNLDDEMISNLDKNMVAGVQQVSDLSWPEFINKIAGADDAEEDEEESETIAKVNIYTLTGTSAPNNSFFPINAKSYTLNYNGNGCTIAGITVDDTVDAGLFGTLSSGSEVSDLELVDFNIQSTQAAGALAGTASNAKISGVLVHHTAAGTSGISGADAGGLVGSITGSTVEQCAAAGYVSATGNAGGLIGTASTTNVTDSYSGGHTKDGRYTDLSTGDARINVISTGASAGGLIGHVTGRGNSISYSYSTASAIGDDAAGGLIGSVAEDAAATVSYTYSTGKVFLTDASKGIYPFIGSGYVQVTYSGKNYYLANVSDNAQDYTGTGYTNLACVTKGSKEVKEFIIDEKAAGENGRQEAQVYDKTLLVDYAGRYFFPTVKQLHYLHVQAVDEEGERVYPDAVDYSASSEFAETFTARHYGDWQVPGLTPLNYTFVNEHTLYTDVTLEADTDVVTFALYGESSQVARVFILDVQRDSDGVSLSIKREGVVRKDATTITDWKTSDFSPIVFGTPDASGVFRVTLDDISAYVEEDEEKVGSGHFAQLFADSFADDTDESKLIPGENVTLLVGGGEGSWTELKDLKETTWASLTAAEKENAEKAGQSATYNSCAKTENSLFGPMSSGNAKIVYYRHLQNLDVDVSDAGNCVNAATFALAGATNKVIQWSTLTAGSTETTTYSEIFNKDGSAYVAKPETGSLVFSGIRNDQLTTLSGENYTIVGMPIEEQADFHKFDDSDKNNAGFFRYVNPQNKDEKDEDDEEEGESYTFTISNLHLQDVSVTSDSGNAGAFAAEIASGKSLKLDTVLAEGSNAEIKSTGGAAGGLVGLANGSATIENSAASVLVTANGAAGGLIGQQAAGTADIKNSYVGGHTTGGLYYVEAAPISGAGRWNIISYSGAAGGLIGDLSVDAKAKMLQSFNTATVYSGAEITGVDAKGKAGGIIGEAMGTLESLTSVYVIAPVSNVQAIVYDSLNDRYVTTDGGAGSVIGVSGNTGDTDPAINGSGFYFIPEIYSNPIPVTLQNGNSNIKVIGAGKIENVNLATYYVNTAPGADNTIIGIMNPSVLEDMTASFDSAISQYEYPFTIWTSFAFDGTAKLYFYGDWQPVQSQPTKDLIVHFLAQVPDETITVDGVDYPKYEELSEQEIAVQIPYKTTKLILPYPPYVPGYGYGNGEAGGPGTWVMYYGDQESTVLNGGSVNTEQLSTTTYSNNQSGTSVSLAYADFSAASEEELLDASGKAHLTIVAKYTKKQNEFKLTLFDQDGLASGDTTYRQYGSVQVLTGGEGRTIKTALSEARIPMRSVPGYRFRGWYTQMNGQGDRVYKTVYDETKKSFVLAFNEEYAHKDDAVTGNMVLYAWYEPIISRTVLIDFQLQDENGNVMSLSSVPQFKISFDAEKGFEKTLTLPGSSTLIPTDSLLYSDGTTPDEEEASVDAENRTITLNIAPLTEEELPEADEDGKIDTSGILVHYVYTFTGVDTEAKYVAFAVRYRMHDTLNVTGGTDGDLTTLGNNVYTFTRGKNYPFNPYDGIDNTTMFLVQEDIEPSMSAQSIDGFKYIDSEAVPYGKVEGNYGVNSQDVTIDGKPYQIKWILVLDYERISYDLSYDSMGGTYIAPDHLLYGEKIDSYIGSHVGAATMPKRNGYTFIGWKIDGEFVTSNSGSTITANTSLTMPSDSVKAVAEWVAESREYIVVFWTQNANDNGYSFLYQTTGTASVGTQINSATYNTNTYKNNAFNGSTLDKDFFTVNTSKDNSATITASETPEVLNVYYDRDIMTIHFKRRGEWNTEESNSDGNPYAKVDNEYYPLTSKNGYWIAQKYSVETGNDGTQYALVDGEYVQLTRKPITTDFWRPQYKYTKNSNGAYGIKDGEYFGLLSYSDNGSTKYAYEFRESDSTSNGTYIILENGSYKTQYLYRYNGSWYKTRTGLIIHRYYNEYTGTVYEAVTGNSYSRENGTEDWTGVRYVRTGESAPYQYTQGSGDDAQYKVDTNQGLDNTYGHVKLNKRTDTEYRWYLGEQEYRGTRYKQDGTELYSGKRYTREGTTYTETTADSGTQYGVDERGGHVSLTRQTDTVWTYTLVGKEHIYTGSHYYWHDDNNKPRSNWRTWKGRYLADFGTYGYKWSDVSMYTWEDGTYIQTYLSAFTNDEQVYDLRQDNTQLKKAIYHYTQGVDGYFYNNRKYGEYGYGYDEAKGSDGTFSFSNKYEQFAVAYYTTGESAGFDKDGVRKNTNGLTAVRSGHNGSYPLHIFHTRKKYDLQFYYYDGSIVQSLGTIDDVFYQKPLEDVDRDDFDFLNPERPEGLTDEYHFRGWYTSSGLDEASLYLAADDTTYTIPAARLADKKMPGNDLPLYGKWTPDTSTVTFEVNTTLGEDLKAEQRTFPNIEYGATLEAYIAKDGVLAQNYTPTRDGFEFLYWEDQYGNQFTVSTGVLEDLTLKAKWDPLPQPEYATVYVYHYAYDASEPDFIRKVLNEETGEMEPVQVHAFDTYENQQVGTKKTYTALETLPEPYGKYHAVRYFNKQISIPKEGKTIYFLYDEDKPWTYEVEYWVTYPSVARESWLISEGVEVAAAGTEKSFQLTVDDEDRFHSAYSNIELVAFSMPDGLNGYRFEKFVDQSGHETSDSLVIVTKAEGTVKIKAYLVPDEEAFLHEDIYSEYNGNKQGIDLNGTGVASENYTQLTIPSSVGATPVIHYFYYDASGTKQDAKNAGVYGVRAYVTMKVGSDELLLLQTEDLNSKPAIKFFIDRCNVYLTSGDVTDVYLPTDKNKQAGLKTGTATNYTVTPVGFPAADGDPSTIISYSFSADSFRKNESKSITDYTPNVFSYQLNPSSGLNESNYNFYKVYGRLYVWKDPDHVYYPAPPATEPETPEDP